MPLSYLPPAEQDTQPAEISPAHVRLMAFSTGAIVANIYYIQPLLSAIARDFRISVPSVGTVAMLTQLGAAVGMLMFVPLGDTRERRGLIVSLLIAVSVCLALMATARTYAWLALASFGVGMAASTVHVIVPFAAHLASPAKRGATVGTVLSGLLFGVLLARTFSGMLAVWMGWRAIYAIASVMMLALAGLLRRDLPRSQPVLKLTWLQLIHSTIALVREQPVLREASLLGGIFFCAFSAFWTTLIFYLQTPPYHYGSGVAGLFGLIGAAGAICAPHVGRFADRHGGRQTVLLALLLVVASFGVFYTVGAHILGLIAGVLLLDVGVQAGHISNQTRIYSLIPEARSRLNMFYMICYFTAGAIGSYAGAVLWHRFGWAGVCGLGVTLPLAGIAFATAFSSPGQRARASSPA
jgi:predicted MFS family arabinose efflux permease